MCVQPETDEDTLDAFMATEVMPEVKEKEHEEQQRRQEEKRLLAKQLAVCISCKINGQEALQPYDIGSKWPAEFC